jgi:flagellar biosynthesis protein FlhF
MKIKTYLAKDMRSALALVRDEQGPDAVILSTRSVPGGVEVAAAVDMEAVHEAMQPRQPAPPPMPATAAETPDFSVLLTRGRDTAARQQPPAQQVAVPAVAAAVVAPAAAASPIAEAPLVATPVAAIAATAVAAAAATPVPATPAPQDDTVDLGHDDTPGVGAELRSLRTVLETQLARLAWNDLTRRSPVAAELLKSLTEVGIDAALSADLIDSLPRDLAIGDAHRRVYATLARRVAVTGDELLTSGGRVAFVGPTGVGKTTAIAKLAARWVMQHGVRDIALVSLDAQRFGAQEQLRTLGRLLGVECFTLEDPRELARLLARLGDRRLVLVDTAGMSPRDPEFQTRAMPIAGALSAAGVATWLTLSASAQAGVLEEALRNFATYGPRCCLLTKIDEAASLGGALSLLVGNGLAVSYVSEGQRIPEDLTPARGHQLVSRAVALARVGGAEAGEDLLTRRFGGVAHAIA